MILAIKTELTIDNDVSPHLHHGELSQRLKKPFQTKGDYELQHVVHQTPLIEEDILNRVNCDFVPDPDNEEEEGWWEGRDRVGVWAHHLQ